MTNEKDVLMKIRET